MDTLKGPGWVDLIDLRKLDLAAPTTCVFGQLYGNYSNGLNEVWPDVVGRGVIARALGFVEYGFRAGTTRRYQFLTAAWKKIIAPRKAARRRKARRR